MVGDVFKKYLNKNEPVVLLMAESKFVTEAEKILKRETNLDKVITYHFLNPNENKNEEKDALKEFLKKPYGALITDAEAFNGMQARNIIFVGGRSPNVRWVTVAEYSGK